MDQKPKVHWTGLIDEVVASVGAFDSPTEAGLQIGVDRQVMTRWRNGERKTPRGRVKVALLRWAGENLGLADLKRYGVSAAAAAKKRTASEQGRAAHHRKKPGQPARTPRKRGDRAAGGGEGGDR